MPEQQSFLPTLSVADLQAEATEILTKAKERFRPVATFALFSGGNDSTVAFWLSRGMVDAAVHIVTGIGIREQGRTALDHVRRMCDAARLPLIVLKTPEDEYRHIVLSAKAKGFPGPAFHYVTYHRLKHKRIRELQRDRSVRGDKILLVSGIWKKESKRRNAKYRTPINQDYEARRCWWVNPMLRFGRENIQAVRQYAELPQSEGAALIHKSGECLCGSMAKAEELPEIEYWFPETGKYIRDLEREAAAAGKPYCKWGHGGGQGPAKPVGPLCQGCELFPTEAT